MAFVRYSKTNQSVGQTPALAGDLSALQALNSNNQLTTNDFLLAIQTASRNEDLALLDWSLEHGKLSDENLSKALRSALYNQAPAASIKRLIEQGAYIFSVPTVEMLEIDPSRATSKKADWSWGLIYNWDNPEVVRLLLPHVSPEDQSYSFAIAIGLSQPKNRVRYSNELMEMGIQNTGDNGETLMVVVEQGDLEWAEKLLPHSQPNYDQSKALYHAVQVRDETTREAMVALLLPRCEPQAAQSRALHYAINEGYERTIQQLLPRSDLDAVFETFLNTAKGCDPKDYNNDFPEDFDYLAPPIERLISAGDLDRRDHWRELLARPEYANKNTAEIFKDKLMGEWFVQDRQERLTLDREGHLEQVASGSKPRRRPRS